jgi:hypothetical protein
MDKQEKIKQTIIDYFLEDQCGKKVDTAESFGALIVYGYDFETENLFLDIYSWEVLIEAWEYYRSKIDTDEDLFFTEVIDMIINNKKECCE